MRRGVRPMTLEYKGARTTFGMPGWYCDASDESIHTGEDMKVSDRALNRLKAEREGLPLPEEIKRIRLKLGLTKETAGELIGGGPRAYSITSSARSRINGGIVRPSALAVLRLSTTSNLEGRCAGRSAGFEPFRMRAT
jgi:putative zinc finger/helix-turn-helix YgiT family protein